MNVTEVLDRIPLWGVCLFSFTIIILSIEIGFRQGRRRHRKLSEGEVEQAGPLVAASLSLLAFMLAMVFSTVDSRWTELKHVALDEANAIGTAYMRADLLPEADRAATRRLLNDYVNLRIEALDESSGHSLEDTIDRSEEMQSVLWSTAANVAGQHPTPTAALFVASVNDLLDLQEKRITLSVHYRLPGIIWVVLIGLTILAMSMGGYATGLSASRRLWALTLAAALAFSVVILLLVALERTHQQVWGMTQAPLLDLQRSIRQSKQSQP